MSQETMDLQAVAAYLQRDAREVQRLASRGHLPGKKISGEWRFIQSEINEWLEQQMPQYTEQQLSRLERTAREQVMISAMLSEAAVGIPLNARSKTSVLKELVQLAEQTWEVFDPEAVLKAVRQREERESTAMPGGVAVPHPHRPLPGALGDNVIAFGRTYTGIPFGGRYGGETDLFFLVLCRDHHTHLTVLARLSRLFLQDGFLAALREVEDAKDAIRLIEEYESRLL